MSIAVLMTCHNRKGVTLNCISQLLPQLGDGDRVFLVDDGSTDGTAEAVNALVDTRITLVIGSGSLYWARSMRVSWDAAGDDWGGYLWLNDDTELANNALGTLKGAMSLSQGVVVGELSDSNGKIVYGTREKGLFTGNCVLVSRSAADKIGRICGDFSHAWADSDYAMRCKRAGVKVVSAGIVGHAEGHPNRPSLRGRTLRERWRLLSDPKGWNVRDLWLYRRRNWGVCVAVFSCLHLIWHVVVGER